jgi:hypothetical protein
MTIDRMTMWNRQILAIMRIDLAKTFFSKRGLWIYLLAFCPAVPMLAHWLFARIPDTLGEDIQVFAGIFQ